MARISRGEWTGAIAVAVVLSVAASAPASAVTKIITRHAAVPTLSLDVDNTPDRFRANTLTSFAPGLTDPAKFSFTAPGATPANARMATAERAFRFTPSGKIDNRRAFSVGVTSRLTAPAVDTSRAAAVPVEVAAATPVRPAAYSVDLAAGWRNFSVSGGYGRSDSTASLPPALALSLAAPKHEAVDVGVSYRGASWKTSLQVGAESGPSILLGPLTSATPTAVERRYSVEVGGAYLLTPRLSLTGGVKVKTMLGPAEPERHDRDQSVYLGTALTF